MRKPKKRKRTKQRFQRFRDLGLLGLGFWGALKKFAVKKNETNQKTATFKKRKGKRSAKSSLQIFVGGLRLLRIGFEKLVKASDERYAPCPRDLDPSAQGFFSVFFPIQEELPCKLGWQNSFHLHFEMK